MPEYNTLSISPASDSTFRLLQVTDPHLYEDPARTLMGVNTDRSLQDCISLARKEHCPCDLVLMTGDLVHDESEAAYQRLKTLAQQENSHTAVLAGNHDDPMLIQQTFNTDSAFSGDCIEAGNWQVILLNSHKPGSEAGMLSASELQKLEACLQRRTGEYTLVTMHHPPVAINSSWLDTMQLENSKAFWDIIYQYPNIQAILFGHVHQEYDQRVRNTRLLATPSTCIQFKPESESFELDMLPPGYRWLELHNDGTIDTGVVRIDDIPEGLDTKSHGY